MTVFAILPGIHGVFHEQNHVDLPGARDGGLGPHPEGVAQRQERDRLHRWTDCDDLLVGRDRPQQVQLQPLVLLGLRKDLDLREDGHPRPGLGRPRELLLDSPRQAHHQGHDPRVPDLRRDRRHQSLQPRRLHALLARLPDQGHERCRGSSCLFGDLAPRGGGSRRGALFRLVEPDGLGGGPRPRWLAVGEPDVVVGWLRSGRGDAAAAGAWGSGAGGCAAALGRARCGAGDGVAVSLTSFLRLAARRFFFAPAVRACLQGLHGPVPRQGETEAFPPGTPRLCGGLPSPCTPAARERADVVGASWMSESVRRPARRCAVTGGL
jgi:hypothetical protein